ncbi:MAG: HEAT repeat domain-containing protein [Ilumatobacteraceae bacterium]
MSPHKGGRRAIAIAGHTGDADTARAGLSDARGDVRATALGALQRLGEVGDDELAAGLVDDDGIVRRRAAELAAGHPAVDLLPALADSDPAVVEAAAWACGEREVVSEDALAALIGLAGGEHAGAEPLVRESAVAALGAIGDDRGLDAILAATSDKPAIRRRAVLALAPFLDPDHPRADEVATAIDRALTDRDWQVRQAAEDLNRH